MLHIVENLDIVFHLLPNHGADMIKLAEDTHVVTSCLHSLDTNYSLKCDRDYLYHYGGFYDLAYSFGRLAVNHLMFL